MDSTYYLWHFLTIVYTNPSGNTQTITSQRRRDCMYFSDIELVNEDGSYTTDFDRLAVIGKHNKKQLIFTNGGWVNKRFETLYSNYVGDSIKNDINRDILEKLGIRLTMYAFQKTTQPESIEDIGCALVEVYISTTSSLQPI